MEEISRQKKYFFNIFWGFFLILSLLGTIKTVITGMDADEQYAITMAYRMACGDRMFMEMWEPHQTSAFLSAGLIRLYLTVTGGVDYLVIYLRLAGALIQLSVSFFVYCTMKKVFSKDISLAAFFLFYNIQPKCQVPEFANMFLWFSTLLFLFLMNYYLEENGNRIWLILAGLVTSLLAISYPTCVLVAFSVVIGIFRVSKKKEGFRNSAVYVGTCICCAVTWLSYCLSHMSMMDFVYGVKQMCIDGSHSIAWVTKLVNYGKDLVELSPHVLVSLGGGSIIWLLMLMLLKRKHNSFIVCVLLAACLEQCYVWIFKNYYLKFPLFFYFVLFLIGGLRYIKGKRDGTIDGKLIHKIMFWFGSVMTLFLWFTALMASNTHIYEFGEYMAVGYIVSISYLEFECKKNPFFWRLAILVLLGAILFKKGFLMYHTYGKDTVLVTKQKVLAGPLAGVYCRWSEGTKYNNEGEIVDKYIPKGSKVLLISTDNLIYLQGQYQICNFSTISTPTIDDRLFEYWERYPEKYPSYVIWDMEIYGLFIPDDTIKERILDNYEMVVEDESLQIYRYIEFP